MPADLDEATLERRLFPSAAAPDCAAMHQELKRKGVTLQLLWEECLAIHGARAYRYSQFCLHYHDFRDRLARSMRQVHHAGDKLFIDYSGDTRSIIDGRTGEVREAQIFVGVSGPEPLARARRAPG